MVNYGANPGRSGHKLSLETAEQVYRSREKCADFFGSQTENTIFTLNCTHALNMAIKGVAVQNCHVITTDLEHNAVIRPLYALEKEHKVTFSIAQTSENDSRTVQSIKELINPQTRIVVCTAASNVTGQLLPLKEIAKLCRQKNLCFIVDMAQCSGIRRVTLADGINIICTAGHKGLYGPMGTGLLVTDGKYIMKTIIEGGTGSSSKSPEQPDFLPDRLESGTINTAGAIALGYGVDFVNEKGIDIINNHEQRLCRYFTDSVAAIPNVRLLRPFNESNSCPLVSFNIGSIPSAEAAQRLSKDGFYLRGGFHCAYLAHKKTGTPEQGAVRFSPSVFSTKAEVTALLKAIERMKE